MNGRAHRLIGLTGYAAMGLYSRHAPLDIVLGVMATYVSSTLPDIDLRLGMKHRGFTHSLLATGLVTGLAYAVYPPIALEVLLGYGLHLMADSLTASGVPLLYPAKHRYGLKILNKKKRHR